MEGFIEFKTQELSEKDKEEKVLFNLRHVKSITVKGNTETVDVTLSFVEGGYFKAKVRGDEARALARFSGDPSFFAEETEEAGE